MAGRISFVQHGLVLALLLFGGGCGAREPDSPPAEPIISARDEVAQQWAAVQSGQRDAMNLAGVVISDADLEPLVAEGADDSEAASPGALREWYLGQSQLTEHGIATIAAHRSLEVLVLGETRLNDAGAAHLSHLPALRILNAPLAEISDRGLASLATIQSLELLRIGSPQLTDQGFAALAGHPNLRQLIVVDTPLTDDVVEHVRHITGLESLYLFNTRLSESALRELQSLVPHVHFN